MSLSQIQDAILIHEYLHRTGVVGHDSQNQRIVLPNGRVVNGSTGVSEAVRDACFS